MQGGERTPAPFAAPLGLSKTSFGAGGFVFEVKTVMKGCLLLLLRRWHSIMPTTRNMSAGKTRGSKIGVIILIAIPYRKELRRRG